MISKMLKLTVAVGLAWLSSALAASAAETADPCQTATRKVMVTQWVPQNYETTRTVYKTEWKDEKYTAYKCELVPEERTRKVTTCKYVPETKDQVVTRYECVPVQEERTVTRYVTKRVPVKETVERCVDKGGHYETREVPCRPHLLHRCCDDCPPLLELSAAMSRIS
jgi:hypothetical protein